jgi:hypothetical protein
MKVSDNLFSDAMDAAVTSYCTAHYLQRGDHSDPETLARKRIAAAIQAYLDEIPQPLDNGASSEGEADSHGLQDSVPAGLPIFTP